MITKARECSSWLVSWNFNFCAGHDIIIEHGKWICVRHDDMHKTIFGDETKNWVVRLVLSTAMIIYYDSTRCSKCWRASFSIDTDDFVSLKLGVNSTLDITESMVTSKGLYRLSGPQGLVYAPRNHWTWRFPSVGPDKIWAIQGCPSYCSSSGSMATMSPSLRAS